MSCTQPVWWVQQQHGLCHFIKTALGEDSEHDNLKKLVMPRQALLKILDPSGSFTDPAVRVAPEPYQREYQLLIIQDRLDVSLDIKGALKIYNYFHLITRQPTWEEVPVGCTCMYASPSRVQMHSSVCAPVQSVIDSGYKRRHIKRPGRFILQLPSWSARSASPSRVLLAGNVCSSSNGWAA
jgi:hypothetical protein